jgi:chemotaxis signal transduction protein
MEKATQRSDSSAEIRVIVFEIDKLRLFGNLSDILEIIRIENCRKLPGSKPYLEGLIEYRENILPLYNTRKRLSLPAIDSDLCLIYRVEKFDFAFRIDRTLGTYSTTQNYLSLPDDAVKGINTKFISSILEVDEMKAYELDYGMLFTGRKHPG